jgi:hypothetical protein
MISCTARVRASTAGYSPYPRYGISSVRGTRIRLRLCQNRALLAGEKNLSIKNAQRLLPGDDEKAKKSKAKRKRFRFEGEKGSWRWQKGRF